MPQGSVLGPLLFVLFIKDLPEVIANHSKLYADDSKILADVGPSITQGAPSLQDDLTRVKQWTDLWLSKLNLFKCEVMHIGTNNPRTKYFIGDHQLNCQDVQRDLGVLVAANLKSRHQSLHAASKATKVLAMLRNAFSSRTAAVWKPLYTTCVRPHLEFAVPAWCPYARGDINIIEKVQRRATELVHELRDLDYQSRCKHLRAVGRQKEAR